MGSCITRCRSCSASGRCRRCRRPSRARGRRHRITSATTPSANARASRASCAGARRTCRPSRRPTAISTPPAIRSPRSGAPTGGCGAECCFRRREDVLKMNALERRAGPPARGRRGFRRRGAYTGCSRATSGRHLLRHSGQVRVRLPAGHRQGAARRTRPPRGDVRELRARPGRDRGAARTAQERARMIVELAAVRPGDRPRVGGKAVGCASLIGLGLPVPRGVVADHRRVRLLLRAVRGPPARLLYHAIQQSGDDRDLRQGRAPAGVIPTAGSAPQLLPDGLKRRLGQWKT